MFTKIHWSTFHWNEHTCKVLKEQHGLETFIPGLNFPSTTGAQGQQACNPISAVIFSRIPLQACWLLNAISESDLLGHLITQRTTMGGESVLVHI